MGGTRAEMQDKNEFDLNDTPHVRPFEDNKYILAVELETDCLHLKSNEILTAVTLFLPLSSICVLEWLTPVRSVQ